MWGRLAAVNHIENEKPFVRIATSNRLISKNLERHSMTLTCVWGLNATSRIDEIYKDMMNGTVRMRCDLFTPSHCRSRFALRRAMVP